jgi:glycosyltransferase involved in cell wall biosynthesis
MNVFTKQDIITSLFYGKLIYKEAFDIECDTVKAISYRDIIELILSNVKNFKWTDYLGNQEVKQPLINILGNIFRDLFTWIFIIIKVLIETYILQKETNVKTRINTGLSLLFLRSDHWFNIKSGGSVGHLSGVINGFKCLNISTHVVSTDYLFGVEQDDCFHLCPPLYELGRNLPNIPKILYTHQMVQSIEKQWKKWLPTFIYQRYSLGNYAGVCLKQKYNVPYICEYNGSELWVARHWGRGKLFHQKLLNRIELLNLQAADLVVVVSQPLKDELVARGIEADKILVNPNGVDSERYSPSVDGSVVRSEYDLNGKIVIGFIGTFGKWHGAEVLAEAFGQLLQEFPAYRDHVRLFLIGDGLTMPLVKEKLTQFNVMDACILTGMVPQEKGPAYLAGCDILASPHVPNPDGTPFFGSPTKLFEYMAMGKGIVASDLEQIGEVLKHNQTAWMVKPGDVQSLKLGLKMLIDDDNDGRRWVRQRGAKSSLNIPGQNTHARLSTN